MIHSFYPLDVAFVTVSDTPSQTGRACLKGGAYGVGDRCAGDRRPHSDRRVRVQLAQAVIRGDYGNGEERRRRLGSFYDAVQARVNEILL